MTNGQKDAFVPTGKPFRIDVHHHVMKARSQAERERFLKQAPDFARMLDWTPAQAIEEMDAGDCQTALNSNSGPLHLDNPEAAFRANRELNEMGAELVRDYPGRFGLFAAIALPHIDEALKEIEYSLDVLKADGIRLPTNFGDTWPGDPKYAPIMDELNRRKAVVFFHPTAPFCCENTVPEIPVHFLEYPTDTARCAMSLVYGGTIKRCPDIKFILSHGGGSLPMLAYRISSIANARPALKERVAGGDVVAAFKNFYVDFVSVANPPAYNAIRNFFDFSHVMFGTDCPFGLHAQVAAETDKLGIEPENRRKMDCENALEMLPRMREFAAAAAK